MSEPELALSDDRAVLLAWRDLATRTDACDRQRAEAAINHLFTQAGERAPHRFVWCDSPGEASFAIQRWRIAWTAITEIARHHAVLGLSRESATAAVDAAWHMAWSEADSSREMTSPDHTGGRGSRLTELAREWADRIRAEGGIRALVSDTYRRVGRNERRAESRSLELPAPPGGSLYLSKLWRAALEHLAEKHEVPLDRVEFEWRMTTMTGSAEHGYSVLWYPIEALVSDLHQDGLTDNGMRPSDLVDVAWFQTTYERTGTVLSPILEAMLSAASECAWWIPFGPDILCIDRPAEISRDGLGRLHSTHGPAISFRDGWCLYAVCGSVCSARWRGVTQAAEDL